MHYYDSTKEDTGELFLITMEYGFECYIYVHESLLADTNTFKLSAMSPEYIQLNKKYIKDIPGKIVAFETFTINDEDVIAGHGAEIFNAYEFNIASGYFSHAEGCDTIASGGRSHAEGNFTTASGQYAHSEGHSTTASGQSAHAEGSYTTASGINSHAEGYRTITSGKNQHVQGAYNIDDIDIDGKALNTYAHIVGNGTSNTKRSNAHTVDWNGNAWFSGDVYVGSTSGTNRDDGSKKLVTEDHNHSFNDLNDKPFGEVSSGEATESKLVELYTEDGTDQILELAWIVNPEDFTGYLTNPNAEYKVDFCSGDAQTIKTTIPFGKYTETVSGDTVVRELVFNDTPGEIYYRETYKSGVCTNFESQISPSAYSDYYDMNVIYVREETLNIKQLDEKYIPDTIARVPSVTQITLTTAAWDDATLSQTVTLNGISADENSQMISFFPVPSSMKNMIESGVYCSAQAENSLTFSCDIIPIDDVTLTVSWQAVKMI